MVHHRPFMDIDSAHGQNKRTRAGSHCIIIQSIDYVNPNDVCVEYKLYDAPGKIKVNGSVRR